MTGAGHRWTGIGAALTAAALARFSSHPELYQFCAGLVATSSTTLPDWVEIPYYRGGVRRGTVIPHRTITHWPPIWIAALVWALAEPSLLGAIVLGASVGALAHILGDAPNPMGVPWLLPFKRQRIGKKGLWRSGENELLMILCFTAVGYGLWRLSGGVSFIDKAKSFL